MKSRDSSVNCSLKHLFSTRIDQLENSRSDEIDARRIKLLTLLLVSVKLASILLLIYVCRANCLVYFS